MTAILTTLAGILSLLFALVVHRTQCPVGFALTTGVRRDGRFVCTRTPVGDDYRDARGIVQDRSTVPPGEIAGWVVCSGGERAVVVDARHVGCQRGGWR